MIAETGEAASIVPPATVIWVVSPAHNGGVPAVVRGWLRASLLHECHHLVRAQTIRSETLMDEVISEGLATAFERDVAAVVSPWGSYPLGVAKWVDELTALPPDADRNHWLRGQHADGRRWIGMRAGAYLADRAIAASGRSAADLVSMPTREVIELAGSATSSR